MLSVKQPEPNNNTKVPIPPNIKEPIASKRNQSLFCRTPCKIKHLTTLHVAKIIAKMCEEAQKTY